MCPPECAGRSAEVDVTRMRAPQALGIQDGGEKRPHAGGLGPERRDAYAPLQGSPAKSPRLWDRLIVDGRGYGFVSQTPYSAAPNASSRSRVPAISLSKDATSVAIVLAQPRALPRGVFAAW